MAPELTNVEFSLNVWKTAATNYLQSANKMKRRFRPGVKSLPEERAQVCGQGPRLYSEVDHVIALSQSFM